ncbi:amino acid kinase [Candidatus Thorarchaeota archaeon]|nr:MAG: amino acid kinase [Candidatus Thorarchaeota archaeon]
MENLTVLKLGGSLLTDKSKPYTLREDVLISVVQEIRQCLDKGLIGSLIVVHGVGSFGHPPVIEHRLHKGFQSPDQLLPISKTQTIVNELRMSITKEFQAAEIPVNLFHPSSMVVSNKMQMEDYFLDSLRGYLKLGMVILLGGDMIFDRAMGFSVGSGDQLAGILAKDLGAEHLLFAMDVDGVYDGDPIKDDSAALLTEISLREMDEVLRDIDARSGADASGAMRGKLRSLMPLSDRVEEGLQIALLSMIKPGRLSALLEGKDIRMTRITH